MTGPLRVSHVVVTDAFAGTERYALEIGGELARRGHDVQIVGGAPTTMQRLLPPAVTWRPGATAPQAVRSLVRGGRRDIVHSHITKADFAVAMAAPATGGARVSTRHITARRGYGAAAARLARVVRAGLAQELAVSSFVADAVETRVDRVLVNGVQPIPDSAAPRDRVVLVAQRLAAEKETLLALRVWAASGLAARGWELHVAGDGPQREELAAAAREVPGVRLLGWVDDLDRLLSTSGILLAPAPAEPCGLTLLEAMAHGLAIVAPHSGGNVETLGRLPGAATFDAGDLNGAVSQLVRLADDDHARVRYGNELRALQRRELTLAGHVDRLESIYRDAARLRRW